MRRFALVLTVLPVAALAQDGAVLSDRVLDLRAGLFCAPTETGRRAAPDTLAGWVHVPSDPVQMVAEGREAPAVLGLGFGVRYLLDTDVPVDIRYAVHHPPMPPGGETRQSWVGQVAPGNADTVFFQFDTENELQPGDWRFSASAAGAELFSVPFTVRPPGDLPGLAGLCRDGALFTAIPSARAEAG